MKLSFTAEFLKQVKEANDIIDVASDYFILQEAAGVYRAHCKHKGGDKTPSLTFFPDTQSFYCFSCHAGDKNHKETKGSDVIDFVQWMEKLSWQDSVILLANRASIQIPKAELTKEDKEKIVLYEVVLNENRGYYNSLLQDKATMDYFTNRGISLEDMTKWRLGSKHGKPVYAILDDQGRTVNFSVRHDNVIGKYVNGETSPIFKKGSILYGLNFIKKEIRKHKFIVIVEGYNDAIILQKFGIPAAALMGTSLTKEHLVLIKKYTNNVILFLDGDDPGVEASIKHIKTLSENDINVEIVSVNGFDPDDVALKHKENTMDYLMRNRNPGFQFILNRILNEHMNEMARLKLKASKELKEVLSIIPNGMDKMIYEKQVEKIIIMEEGDISGIQQSNADNEHGGENARE